MPYVVTSRGEPIGHWEPRRLDHHFHYVWGFFVPAPAFDPLRPIFEAAPDGLLFADLFDDGGSDSGDEVVEGYSAFCRVRDALRLGLLTDAAAVSGARIVGATRRAGAAGQNTWELLIRTNTATFERIAHLHYLNAHAPDIFARFAHAWTRRAEREEGSVAELARAQRAADVLGRTSARKKNPVFIGPAGATRDQLVAETVGLLLAGEIGAMAGWQVAAFDVAALCALRTWEEANETLKAIAWQGYYASPRTLFVIDRLDELLPRMAATFKPLLGYEQIRFIGTATLEDYRAKIEKEPLFQRCVQEILAY
jgi:hypothetical protein